MSTEAILSPMRGAGVASEAAVRAATVRGVVWMIAYLAFIVVPLFALLLGAHPPARSFVFSLELAAVRTIQ